MNTVELKTVEKLEFKEIRQFLTKRCSHPLSRKWSVELPLATSFQETEDRLYETQSALDLLRRYPLVPFASLPDMEGSVAKVVDGFLLNGLDIYSLTLLLTKVKEVKDFFVGKDIELGVFTRLLNQLELEEDLRRRMMGIADEEGHILDGASERLSSIRKKIDVRNRRLKERAEELTRKGPYVSYLQDPVVVKRGESYCLSVKREHGHQVDGVICDTSGSGNTLFIEPREMEKIRSELNLLRREETEEVEAILKDISERCALLGTLFEEDFTVLGHYDFYLSKGMLSKGMDAVIPLLNNRGIVDIKGGRHPLLTGSVVANDVSLGEDFSILVITGPNTGGKTVLLKMVGLFALMVRLGLGIPCNEGSQMGFFRQVFADIGDEQSISHSLSTFSSHMVQIGEMVTKADHESLLLFDELGSGTDPKEGSSLAMGIIDELLARGSRVILTTHYGELKAYAYETEGVENGSVTFDKDTYAPTYKLIIGTPGTSLGITIAKRYGLKDSIIKKAEGYLESSEKEVGNLLEDLEKKRDEYEKLVVSMDREKRQLMKERESLEQEQDRFYSKLEEKKLKEKEKRANYLRELQIEGERIIEDLKAEFKEGHMDAANSARKKIEGLKGRNSGSIETKGASLESVAVGESVYLTTVGKEGIVESVQEGKKKAVVRIGIMKVSADFKNLRKVEAKKESEILFKKGSARKANVALELDLRGMNLEESIDATDKYLDDAYLANYPFVRIIHGRGTGVLKNGLWEYFKSVPVIKSYRLGEKGEGSDGVTVVYFK